MPLIWLRLLTDTSGRMNQSMTDTSTNCFFICQALKPVDLEFTSQETSQLGWFDVDDLPALSVARVLAQQIVLLHNHWQDPDIAYVD